MLVVYEIQKIAEAKSYFAKKRKKNSRKTAREEHHIIS